MKNRFLVSAATLSIAAVSIASLGPSCSSPTPSGTSASAPAPAPAPGPAPAPAPAIAVSPVVAKPLSPEVEKGLAWLIARQHPDGGFSQGEESAAMGGGGQLRDRANVADTCIAALALIRAGSTPASGRHAAEVARAIAFVCGEVEAAPEAGLLVTSVQGTRVQMKLGPFVDTFLASMLLAEARGHMPDAAAQKRVVAALDKVMDKIEKNQRPDGSFTNEGWAPVIAQGLATKGMNRAAQVGAPVSVEALDRAEKWSRSQFDEKSGSFGGSGSAGVALYTTAANAGAMADSQKTAEAREEAAKKELGEAIARHDASGEANAQAKLKDYEAAKVAQVAAQGAVTARLDDAQFLQGFGSNGGEEFLSYMQISESLAQKGGPEWAKWDAAMSQNLARIQNADGSWTGHHCITGRNFCTAAALLVLTADRAPFPVAAKVARG
jgi:hypothetical protein